MEFQELDQVLDISNVYVFVRRRLKKWKCAFDVTVVESAIMTVKLKSQQQPTAPYRRGRETAGHSTQLKSKQIKQKE